MRGRGRGKPQATLKNSLWDFRHPHVLITSTIGEDGQALRYNISTADMLILAVSVDMSTPISTLEETGEPFSLALKAKHCIDSLWYRHSKILEADMKSGSIPLCIDRYFISTQYVSG